MRNQKIAKWVILGYVFIAIFHPFLANDKPIICKVDGDWVFPIFSSLNIDHSSADFKIMPPIPYAASTINTDASLLPPFQSNHWLGTDILGRDTLAGILKGTEIAVKIGFISVFLAAIFALLIGLSVSYYRRFPFYLNIIQCVILTLSLLVFFYYGWIAFSTSLSYLWAPIVIILLVNVAAWKLFPSKKRTIQLPIDGLYLRFIEAMKAIPGLIMILAFLSIFENFSITGLVLILAFLMWPGLSRYIRAEALKILSQDYIVAAKAYGAPAFRILRKHVLPKLFTSLSVILAFSISSAIIIESTLSFLGLGIPIEQVSWGSMLKEAQRNISAWWLAVFPGLALFGLILSLNIWGEKKG